MDTLDTLHELSDHIEEDSLSYYSLEETAPHKVESGNPSNINHLEISGALGGEAVFWIKAIAVSAVVLAMFCRPSLKVGIAPPKAAVVALPA